MTRRIYSAFGVAIMLGLVSAAGSTLQAAGKIDPLTIKAPAFLGGGGGDLMVRMRVEPDARSRELTIEWVGEDLSGGSHAITLNGDKAAVTHQFAIKRLGPGQHEVTAILRLSDGKEIRRATTVTIVGVGGVGTPMSGQGAASGRFPIDRR